MRRGLGAGAWLRADLAAPSVGVHARVLAPPALQLGPRRQHTLVQPFWRTLDKAGAEIVLSGHNHDYERFAPRDDNGKTPPDDGIRQFVVGTGRRVLDRWLRDTLIPDSQVAQNNTFGVLYLTLHAGATTGGSSP